MSHTYYINSATGSDANSGLSSATAFKSLAVLNKLVLQPGDTVLLARGTSYSDQLSVKYSGTADHPITFGAYGKGDAPVIKGASTGIYSSGTHDVVVHDLAIANTSGYAVFGSHLTRWTVDNITVSNTGSASHFGSVSFESSSSITVQNSRINGVTGDGILVNGGKAISLLNNKVGTVQGQNGDNIQVNNVTKVVIDGNTLDMTGKTNSTKGNLVVNKSTDVEIEHNTLVGGKYGASVNSNDVTIASNDIHGQKGYDWSFGIGVGESWNVKNYDIHDNDISDVAYGVSISGVSKSVQRTNIDVHDNTFNHIDDAALKVDRAASGEFVDNQIGSDTKATQISTWIAAEGKFLVSGNDTFDLTTAKVTTAPTAAAKPAPAPAVHVVLDAANDTVKVGASGVVSGNALANDHHDLGDTLHLRTIAGSKVGSSPVEIHGRYGTLTIANDGSYTYDVDAAKVHGKTVLRDSFMYKVSDGHTQDSASLGFSIDPHVLHVQATSDFHL